MKKCEFYIESLNPERVIDKLVSRGVMVLSAQKPQKNAVVLSVDGKDSKKVFAILQSSCYNIKKVRPRSLLRARQLLVKSAGLLLGAALFLSIVCFAQSRVLAIRVEGSGAYYGEDIKAILRDGGTAVFSSAPKDTSSLAAKIMALPRVSFCSVNHAGGILTIDVEVNNDQEIFQTQPLIAPVSGTVERLTAVRGTPLVLVGDSVREGQALVADYAVYENGTRAVLVIAEAVIAYPVSKEYALEENRALAQAFLDYGELTNITTSRTDGGTLIEAVAHAGVTLNLE